MISIYWIFRTMLCPRVRVQGLHGERHVVGQPCRWRRVDELHHMCAQTGRDPDVHRSLFCAITCRSLKITVVWKIKYNFQLCRFFCMSSFKIKEKMTKCKVSWSIRNVKTSFSAFLTNYLCFQDQHTLLYVALTCNILSLILLIPACVIFLSIR